jgi:hypothetical protein
VRKIAFLYKTGADTGGAVGAHPLKNDFVSLSFANLVYSYTIEGTKKLRLQVVYASFIIDS